MSEDLESYKVATGAVLEAGRVILEIYNSEDFSVEMKSDNSPLTRADKAANTVIEKALKRTGIHILSEEGRAIPYSERSKWTKFWMVDPLDGTKEFIKKNDDFTVNIALIEDGKPTFGIIYIPTTDTLYIGGSSFHPYKVQQNKKTVLKQAEDISLDRKLASNGLRVIASLSHASLGTSNYIRKLAKPTIQERGSSLKFMLLADGEVDIYPRFTPCMEWDSAAAHAILRPLGYHIVNADTLQELNYNKRNLLNPNFICY